VGLTVGFSDYTQKSMKWGRDGSQIDYQLELGRLLDRQLSKLRAAQDLVNVAGGTPPRTGDRDDPRVTCNAPRAPLPHPPDGEPHGDLRRPEGRLVTCNVLELARRGGHQSGEAIALHVTEIDTPPCRRWVLGSHSWGTCKRSVSHCHFLVQCTSLQALGLSFGAFCAHAADGKMRRSAKISFRSHTVTTHAPLIRPHRARERGRRPTATAAAPLSSVMKVVD
jgi:hypothetical protein